MKTLFVAAAIAACGGSVPQVKFVSDLISKNLSPGLYNSSKAMGTYTITQETRRCVDGNCEEWRHAQGHLKFVRNFTSKPAEITTVPSSGDVGLGRHGNGPDPVRFDQFYNGVTKSDFNGLNLVTCNFHYMNDKVVWQGDKETNCRVPNFIGTPSEDLWIEGFVVNANSPAKPRMLSHDKSKFRQLYFTLGARCAETTILAQRKLSEGVFEELKIEWKVSFDW